MTDATTDATTPSTRVLRTRRGEAFDLPMFLPVYQPGASFLVLPELAREFGIRGCISNAFFLYKDRAMRALFEAGRTLREHIGIDGLLMTDSGAFQGFTRPLHLSNKVIVKFQDMIGTDITSPLDLVSPPGDNRTTAERKMATTLERIREAKGLVERSILAGVQQGGRFLDLRRRCAEELVTIGVDYVAIGSLVPFFNVNHELGFVGAVLRDARRIIGDTPMHVFGSGDPVELPFLVALGADIFDSSSYGHYARQGFYMTPFGAVKTLDRVAAGEYRCGCVSCRDGGATGILTRVADLATHNLWTICDTMRRIRKAVAAGTLPAMLAEVLERHSEWFPESRLKASWDQLHS